MRNVSKPFHWYVRSDFKMLHKSKYKSIGSAEFAPRMKVKLELMTYIFLSDFITLLFLVFMSTTVCPHFRRQKKPHAIVVFTQEDII